MPADIDVERIKDDLEVLSFYQFFIAVKVDRAYSSKFYEENDPEDETMDSKTSAFLAHHALEKMGLALLNLSYQKPLSKLKKRFLTLAKTSLNLAEVVSEEFLT